MRYDVVIVGGGPAGLAAALTLGRARKQVLLCDSGPRRNAAAVHVQNFVTRDGTPPVEFRRIAREQLETYPNVAARDVRVESISGTRNAFRVALSTETVEARRILLATGMIDDPLPIEGFSELWGSAIFQCPYCHGWELRDRAWGYIVSRDDVAHSVPFGLMLRGWTKDVALFTNGADVPEESMSLLASAAVRVEKAPIARLAAREGLLEAVELSDGSRVPREVLFAHPPQRQVELVNNSGVAFDEEGFVQVDPMLRQTSVPGIYAAGDSTTRMQVAIGAAAMGTQTAGMINVDLAMDFAGA